MTKEIEVIKKSKPFILMNSEFGGLGNMNTKCTVRMCPLDSIDTN